MIKEMSIQSGAATTTAVKNKKTVGFKEIEEENIIKVMESYLVPPHDTELIMTERNQTERAIQNKVTKKYSEVVKQQFSFKKPVGLVEDKVSYRKSQSPPYT